MNLDDSDLEKLEEQSVDIVLSVNELRIIVDCFRAIAYLGKIDGEAYLDPDGLEIKERLEKFYFRRIEELGITTSAKSDEQPKEMLPEMFDSGPEDPADPYFSSFEPRSHQATSLRNT